MPSTIPVVGVAVATPVAAPVNAQTPIVSVERAHVAAPVVTPFVIAAPVVAAVSAQVLPPAGILTAFATPANANPSPVALARAVTPHMDRTESTTKIYQYVYHRIIKIKLSMLKNTLFYG